VTLAAANGARQLYVSRYLTVTAPPEPMTASLLESYETVAYESRAILFADPDSLAAMARLHGFETAPPERCRVLEIGCAAGMNIITPAFLHPKSHFVGIDLSPSQIDVGRRIVSEMALQNVELIAGSISDLDPALGEFDYIVCHGVFSWVPPDIQEAILAVCERHLSANGVALISYNTFPGWHRRLMVREMLMFHDDHSLPTNARIARGREFASFLAAADSDVGSLHAAMLRDEAQQIENETDPHFYHEQLEAFNAPLYFWEFIERASAHGLEFIGEARPTAENPAIAAVREKMGAVDRIRMEQYIDFVVGRTFRRTILRRRRADALADSPRRDVVPRLFLRSRAVSVAPSADAAQRGPGVAAFRGPLDTTITTNNPLVVAMLHILADAAPRAVGFDDLRSAIVARLRESTDPDAHSLADDPLDVAGAALQCAPAGLIEFVSLPSAFVNRVSARPKASALARWQAIHVHQVSSLGHWTVPLTPIEQFLLQYLDGTADRGALVRRVEAALASGQLSAGSRPGAVDIAAAVDEVLARMARAGLLVS
jgi:SAM-dependent methyltransferase/methyltransferase-like protein